MWKLPGKRQKAPCNRSQSKPRRHQNQRNKQRQVRRSHQRRLVRQNPTRSRRRNSPRVTARNGRAQPPDTPTCSHRPVGGLTPDHNSRPRGRPAGPWLPRERAGRFRRRLGNRRARSHETFHGRHPLFPRKAIRSQDLVFEGKPACRSRRGSATDREMRLRAPLRGTRRR